MCHLSEKERVGCQHAKSHLWFAPHGPLFSIVCLGIASTRCGCNAKENIIDIKNINYVNFQLDWQDAAMGTEIDFKRSDLNLACAGGHRPGRSGQDARGTGFRSAAVSGSASMTLRILARNSGIHLERRLRSVPKSIWSACR